MSNDPIKPKRRFGLFFPAYGPAPEGLEEKSKQESDRMAVLKSIKNILPNLINLIKSKLSGK